MFRKYQKENSCTKNRSQDIVNYVQTNELKEPILIILKQ